MGSRFLKTDKTLRGQTVYRRVGCPENTVIDNVYKYIPSFDEKPNVTLHVALDFPTTRSGGSVGVTFAISWAAYGNDLSGEEITQFVDALQEAKRIADSAPDPITEEWLLSNGFISRGFSESKPRVVKKSMRSLKTSRDALEVERFNTICKAVEGTGSINKCFVDEFKGKSGISQKFLVIEFRGGGLSVRNIMGNSLYGNILELGKLYDGGYYREVAYYKKEKGLSE